MNIKFNLATFIFADNGFFEYETLQDLKNDQGKELAKRVIGYYPPNTNITYDQLNNVDDGCFTLAIIDDHGVMYTKIVESLDELHKILPTIKTNDNSPEYITIYRKEDFVKLQIESQKTERI
jgi:hypothetical protein